MKINNRKVLEVKGTIISYLMIMRCSNEEAKKVLQLCMDEVESEGKTHK